MKTFVSIFIAVVVFVGLGFYLFTKSNKPVDPANLPGQTFENQGQAHIPAGEKQHLTYNSNPPSSGPHWPAPAEWGIYKAQQPDELLVHNLEHGGIWISYKPDTEAETIKKLEDFATRYRKIIIEPRAENDQKIALSAWTHVQKMDVYDENTILKFIEAYYDQGPEKVP